MNKTCFYRRAVRSRLARITAFIGCATMLNSIAAGQDNPFGNNPFETAEATADPVAPENAAVQPATADDTGTQKPDFALQSIVESNPQTPFELIRAADMLMNIDRDDLAIGYIQQIAQMNLSDEQNYELYKQAGSDRIFRISVRTELGEVGRSFARSVTDGAEQFAMNAARIQTLTEQVIRNEDKYQRSLALAELKRLGDTGVAALMEKLVDENYKTNWPRIRQAIRLFGRAAEGPVMAAWQSNSLKLQVEALSLLGDIKSSDAVETLMAPLWSGSSTQLQKHVAKRSIQKLTGRVPGQGECELKLYRSAEQYLMDQVVLQREATDQVKWWRWDADSRSFTPTWLTARTIARIRGFRRARDLVELNAGREDYQRLYWVARMESAKLTSGLQQPMPSVVVKTFVGTMQPEMALNVLRDALRMQREPAAIAACEVLGEFRQDSFLESSNGSTSPLIQAIDYGSVRLMKAACDAIYKINPNQAFAGSSNYLSSLVYMSRSVGTRTAIVGHVNLEKAQSIAALASRSGFSAYPVTGSRDLFDKAKNDPDLQLIIITDKLGQPAFSELVQLLRSTTRTRQIPVLLMVEPDQLIRAERLADRFPNTRAVPMFASEHAIARQIDNLNQNLAYQDATQIERTDYAVTALDQLGHYAASSKRYPFLDLVNHQEHLMGSLGTPSSASSSCRLLGRIGTAEAQVNLVDMASNIQLPESLRQTAAEAFAEAVKQRGLMLSRDQILTQYDRYNASENQPAETQKIFAYLLDAIEKRLE